MAGHRFVYGPVASRRLGFSLGVDIIPFKTCTLDCIYCQLGSTRRTTVRRRSFFPTRAILAQVRAALGSGQRIDVITFSGSGEPTLNKDIGGLIRAIKRMSRLPVAVLTNGTLLTRSGVRRDLAAADVVVPSLDAVPASLFRRVNRPHGSLDIAKIVDGLARFRDEYSGEIRLEIMLVKGVNDTPAAIAALKAAVARIRPDRIELNTVVRPPSERRAAALGPADMRRVRAALGPRAEIVASFARRKQAPAAGALEKAVLDTVRRRPQTAEDIAVALGRHRDEVLKTLASLLERGRVRQLRHRGRTYFRGRAGSLYRAASL
jgi:wyosine [tRNA(Phe)-imidazoG37] synthetase (radical SAM superfamily)